MNANIDGNTKVMYALTAVKGVGRRYANIILKKADIDLNKRAGELSDEEVSVVTCPVQSWHMLSCPILLPHASHVIKR